MKIKFHFNVEVSRNYCYVSVLPELQVNCYKHHGVEIDVAWLVFSIGIEFRKKHSRK